jgi:hypothetical protein
MMKGRNTLLVLAAAGLLLSLPVQAQRGGSPGSKFDDRLDRQSSAIQRGIDSGELTRRETRTLRREQDETRQFMRDVRRDGYPPHEARRMIERRLDRVDRQIRKLSSNRDVAPHSRDDRRGPPPRDSGDRRDPPRNYDDRR